jgi:FAD/FMN-containing dehydrogenase
MTTQSPLTVNDLVAALRAVVRGDVVTPDDASFPAAAFGVEASAASRPGVVVIAAHAGDVVAVVRAATRAGRRVVVQATGNAAVSAGPNDILLVTRLLARVRIDPLERTATVGAGSTWRQVLAAAESFGLVPVSSAADSEPIARTFAFAADHLRSVEVVTVQGDLVTLDVRQDPDLFSALRRRRAAFGLVTAATIELLPLDRLYAGGLWYAEDSAATVQRRWRDWVADLPATARTSLTRITAPAAAGVPAALWGRDIVHVRFAHVGEPAAGAELLAPMRDAAPVLLDSVVERSYASLVAQHPHLAAARRPRQESDRTTGYSATCAVGVQSVVAAGTVPTARRRARSWTSWSPDRTDRCG